MTHDPVRTPPSDDPWVEFDEHDGHRRTLVWLRGAHDMATADALWDSISSVSVGGRADVVVDLSGVTFMDASTVAVLQRTHQRLEHGRSRLELRSPSPPAQRVIDLCGLASPPSTMHIVG